MPIQYNSTWQNAVDLRIQQVRDTSANEPPHDKTNKMACAPSEDCAQLGHLPSLIKVFIVRLKKACVLSYPWSAQRRHWSDWADSQADLSLRWAHSHFVCFIMRRLKLFLVLFPCATQYDCNLMLNYDCIWAPSSEFVSSSIPSWQTLTAHAQPFRGARDLAFCLKVPLDSLLVLASSEGSGETARMRRLARTFAARIGDKYQIRLTRSILSTILMLKLSRPEFPSSVQHCY